MTAPASREELVEAIVRGFETADQWQDLGWAGKKLYRKFASAALAAIEAAGCAVVPVAPNGDMVLACHEAMVWIDSPSYRPGYEDGIQAAIEASPYREK